MRAVEPFNFISITLSGIFKAITSQCFSDLDVDVKRLGGYFQEPTALHLPPVPSRSPEYGKRTGSA